MTSEQYNSMGDKWWRGCKAVANNDIMNVAGGLIYAGEVIEIAKRSKRDATFKIKSSSGITISKVHFREIILIEQ